MQILLTKEEYDNQKKLIEKYEKLINIFKDSISIEIKRDTHIKGLMYCYYDVPVGIKVTINSKKIFNFLNVKIDPKLPIEIDWI